MISVSNSHLKPSQWSQIDVVLLADDAYENFHYVWIKVIKNSKFQWRKDHYRCLCVFSTEGLLHEHIIDCMGVSKKPQKIVMPE